MNDEGRARGAAPEQTGGGKSGEATLSPAGDNVPPHRPWARRADAHATETRYRRSVYYWRRRPVCVHGRRADECAS